MVTIRVERADTLTGGCPISLAVNRILYPEFKCHVENGKAAIYTKGNNVCCSAVIPPAAIESVKAMEADPLSACVSFELDLSSIVTPEG